MLKKKNLQDKTAIIELQVARAHHTNKNQSSMAHRRRKKYEVFL